MEVIVSSITEKLFRSSILKDGVVSFYVFVIVVIVLAIILGQPELSGGNPGYNIYDCKHSLSSCKKLFGGDVVTHKKS